MTSPSNAHRSSVILKKVSEQNLAPHITDSFSAVEENLSDQIAQESNWVFIDIQNLYQGIKERNWQINWSAFRQYLSKKYNAAKAVVFIGHVSKYARLYKKLRAAGFHIEFRQVYVDRNGLISGGNVDADLAAYVFDKKSEYSKAIIVADDGDYHRTIQSLKQQNKLKLIISSHLLARTSQLIKNAVSKDMLISIHGLRNQISQK
jgi:NYN domain